MTNSDDDVRIEIIRELIRLTKAHALKWVLFADSDHYICTQPGAVPAAAYSFCKEYHFRTLERIEGGSHWFWRVVEYNEMDAEDDAILSEWEHLHDVIQRNAVCYNVPNQKDDILQVLTVLRGLGA